MTSTRSDFVIRDEEFYGGFAEILQQNVDAFNAASNGAIMLATARKKGDFEKESFFNYTAGLTRRRLTTSIADVADLTLTMGDHVRVKVNRGIGPVAATLDAWYKLGTDPGEMSLVVGRQTGIEVSADWLNTSIMAVVAALGNVPLVTSTFANTPSHGNLVTTLSKFGDKAGRIAMWVMHSKSYFDLVGQAIVDKIFTIGALAIREGITPTLGIPTLVTDSPALVTTGAPDTYHILGLTQGAISVIESEERRMVSQLVTGKDNLIMRMQGEYAFNLGLKGFAYDEAAGGADPDDAALGAAANWDNIAADVKSLAGVIGNFQ